MSSKKSMLSFAQKYAKNYVYSQFGEEGILSECERRGISIFHCVEIGGNNGHYCSNTALQIESDVGVVTGLFVEADFGLYQQCVSNWKHNALVRCQCCKVDDKNINAFVNDDCDLLSLDTDGWDYRIFAGLKAKPKIVIIEIDSSYPPDVYTFNSDGAGTYRNTLELGISKGYCLLCHTGNLIFIRNEYRELFPEIEGDGLSNAELYFNRGWLKTEVAA